MNHRNIYLFQIFAMIVAFATVLLLLERNVSFTNGFNLATTPLKRVSASETTTRKITSITLARRKNFSTTSPFFPRSSLVVLATNNAYGRGADIWPESNNDEIKLSDSFPNGIVPYSAAVAVEQTGKESTHQQVRSSTAAMKATVENKNEGTRTTAKPQQRPRKYIKRILKRAAFKEELENENEIGSIGKIPGAIALTLLVRGMVRPMDVALVAFWTAYLTILNMTAQSARDSGAPMLPAVPPQGHVPKIISSPMGMRFERSVSYRRWLNLGALLGLIGPLACLLLKTVVLPLRGTAEIELEASRVVARPLFLMCCQVTTEAISKRNMVPLPLRILVPIVYNASRLVYLWCWAFSATNLSVGRIGRCLGIVNAVYWALNLFAFLIPIACLRYMRAHFFVVEAEEVTTRIGLEETIGIVPRKF